MLRKAIFSFGFLLLSLVSWAQPGNNLQMANMQFDLSRNFQEAAKLYESLLSSGQLTASERLQALRRLAASHRLLNEPKQAAEYYERLKKEYPSAIKARDHFFHGYVLQMQGKYDEAKQAYQSYRMLAGSKEANYFYKDVIDYAKQESQAASSYDIRLEKVNSDMDDFSPAFYKSGLLYASKKRISNVETGGGNVLDNVYIVSRASNGALHSAKRLTDSDGNAPSNAAPIAVDNPRKRIYYSLNMVQDGVRHVDQAFSRLDLYEEDYAKNGTPSLTVGEPILWGEEGAYQIGFPAISPDGKTLVVGAKKDGEPFNLYQLSRNSMGEWVNPKKLELNTLENDLAPYIDKNNVLYYSSDGGAGLGGLDVYMATYDAQKQTWTTPGNLGVGVNSSYDDLYFIWDADTQMGYFSSNRPGGKGGLDIYRAMPKGNSVTITVEPQPNTGTPESPTTKPKPSTNTGSSNTTTKPAPSSSSSGVAVNPATAAGNKVYYGALLDKETKQPLRGATVMLREAGTTSQKEATQTNEYGEYAFKLEEYTEYTLVCSKQEYEYITFTINTRDGRQRLILGERMMYRPEGETLQPFSASGTNSNSNTTTSPNLGASRSLVDNAEYRLGDRSELPQQGYKIQLGLFAKSGPDVKRRLAPLKRYGLLMSEERSNGNVYALGVYAKRDHAASVLSKVKKRADFKDAFLREVDLDILTPTGQAAEEERVIYPLSSPSSGGNSTLTSNEAPQRLDYRLGTTAELPEEGYYLQLGAYKDLDAATKADLNDLRRYAKLFPIERGGLTAYRLGLFAEKAHADRVKEKLQNTRFKDAYLGTEPIDQTSAGKQTLYVTRVVYPKESNFSSTGAKPNNWVLDAPMQGSTGTSTGGGRSWANNAMADAKPEEELPEQAKVRSANGVAYKVQLGAFSRPDDFDVSRFEEIGYVETKKTAAGLTYFFLANYPSVDAARAASRQAEAKGINNPTIVAYFDGKRISLQKAMAMDK